MEQHNRAGAHNGTRKCSCKPSFLSGESKVKVGVPLATDHSRCCAELQPVNHSTLKSVLAMLQEKRVSRGGSGRIVAYSKTLYNHANERITEPNGNGVYCYPKRGRPKPPHQGKNSTATGKADIAWEGSVKLQVIPDDTVGDDYLMSMGGANAASRLYIHQILIRTSILVRHSPSRRIPGSKVIELAVFDESFLIDKSGFIVGLYGEKGDPRLGAWNWDEFCSVASHEYASLTLEERAVKSGSRATLKPFLYFGRQVTRTDMDGISGLDRLATFVTSRADDASDYDNATVSGYSGEYTMDFSIDHCKGTVEVEDPPPPDTRNPPDPPPPDGGGGTPTPPWFE